MRSRPEPVVDGEKAGQATVNIGEVIDRLRANVTDQPKQREDLEILISQVNTLHNQVLSLTGWREGALESLALACGRDLQPT